MTAHNSNNDAGNVKEKVRAFVLEYAAARGVTEIGDDEPILTNNIIDSLGSLRMIDFLETAFPLTIEDTDMLPENFQTLNACEIFINQKLGIGVNGSAEPNGSSAGSGSAEVNGSANSVADINAVSTAALAMTGKD